LVVLDRSDGTLRVVFVLYALAGLLAFAIANPLGGNMGRLGATFGAPLAVTIGVAGRRWLVGALAVPLAVWQWAPLATTVWTGQSSSSRAAYYAPLLQYLAGQARDGRLEIPLTAAHWETAFVPPVVPLARGWYRQLDTADNAIFYDGEPLTADSYRQWLDASGVKWVAVPDVAFDRSAINEVALIRTGLPYLQPVWHDAHWHVWSVQGAPGIVTGPATLVSMGTDGFTLNAQPGTVLVRVRFGTGWTVPSDQACVARTPDGWTQLTVIKTGAIDVDPRLVASRSSPC
jgi:hypothetical protein